MKVPNLTSYLWQSVKVETTFAQRYCQFELLHVNLAMVNATSVSLFYHITVRLLSSSFFLVETC